MPTNRPARKWRPTIALAMGDPAGISPELTAKVMADRDVREAVRLVVFGDRRVLAEGERVGAVTLDLPVVADAAGVNGSQEDVFVDLRHLDPLKVESARVASGGGAFALRNFRAALALATAGQADAVCFTPFNKQAMRLAESAYEDEIVFCAEALAVKGATSEFNVLEEVWNARVTSHVPLSHVAQLITRDAVLRGLRLTDRAMRAAGFDPPRIGVAGLNPHAGEGGNFGREEIDVITPAVVEAKAEGIVCDGPYPSDTVFVRARAGQFDAVLTMYHDQGQIAMKLMGFERGVTLLGGFPFPITTPAHGTAYDIAGKGIADVGATREAVLLAARMAGATRTGRFSAARGGRAAASA